LTKETRLLRSAESLRDRYFYINLDIKNIYVILKMKILSKLWLILWIIVKSLKMEFKEILYLKEWMISNSLRLFLSNKLISKTKIKTISIR